MKCDRCEKKAEIHYAESVNGKIKRTHLCKNCAMELGLGPSIAYSMGDFIGAMTQGDQAEVLQCPNCKTTLKKFKAQGKLGCADCYKIFEDSLSPIVEQVQRSTQHKGKYPSFFKEDSSLTEQIELLNEKI